MKICSFATLMHIVIKTTCIMDLFIIPLCGKKALIHVFLFYFLGNKMLHRPPSGPPRPGSLLMLTHFLFTCSIFFFILPFVLIITKISNQIAMRKINPWRGWCAISSVQTPNEHAALLDILYKNHNACCSEKFIYWVFSMLLRVTAHIMKFWVINMLC